MVLIAILRWEGKQSYSFPSAGNGLLHRSRGLFAIVIDAIRGGQHFEGDEQVAAGIPPEVRAQQPYGSDQGGIGGGGRLRFPQIVADRRELQQHSPGNGGRGQNFRDEP